MQFFIDLVIVGLSIGMVYALVALGISFILPTARALMPSIAIRFRYSSSISGFQTVL